MDIDLNNLPEKITVGVILMSDDSGYTVASSRIFSGYSVIAEPVKVTFKLLKKSDITKNTVSRLKAESTKILADAELARKSIDDKIKSLLAITNDSE